MARFEMESGEVSRMMRDMGVKNYQELAALYAQKVGFSISARNIKDQLNKTGVLSNSLAGQVRALHIICKLEERGHVHAV